MARKFLHDKYCSEPTSALSGLCRHLKLPCVSCEAFRDFLEVSPASPTLSSLNISYTQFPRHTGCAFFFPAGYYFLGS